MKLLPQLANFNASSCEKSFNLLFHSSRGYFYGDQTYVRIFPFTMIRLTLFLAISNLLRRILKPLKQAEYVTHILAGIILSRSVLGKYERYHGIVNIASQQQFINTAGSFAVLYYVFIIAVKTNSSLVLNFRKQLWIMGLSSLFIPFIIMTILFTMVRPKNFKIPLDSHIFTMQVSSTWFINIYPLLDELNLLTTDFGQLALSLALTHEFTMWAIFFFALVTLKYKIDVYKMPLTLLGMLFVVIFIIRPIMSWIEKQMPRGQPVKESYITGVILGGAIVACSTDILMGTPLMGIVFYGLVVPSGPPLGLAIAERSFTFVKTCLLPFFFLAVGDSVVLMDLVDFQGQVTYQLVLLAGHTIKTLTITFLGIWYNMSSKQAFALGMILNTSGVVHCYIYWNQWMHGKLYVHVFSQLVISSLIVTSIVTPISIHFYKSSRKIVDSIRCFQLSVLSTQSSPKMQILACIDNEEDIPGIITLLKASNPTKSSPITIYVVHLIELVGHATPQVIPHKRHRRICKYNGCYHIMSALKTYVDTSEGGVSMQLLTMIAPFTTIYEDICKVAEENVVPLVIVPFTYKSQLHLGKSVSSNLNTKLQQYAPCTLGIFVNKADTIKKNVVVSNYDFSYHILVIFCGGDDDREALTYATRMSTHPGVTITVLRIFVKDCSHANGEDEKKMDESVTDKFKEKVSSNACATYTEVYVEEWLDVIKEVQSIDNSYTYDLVMVGRRHGNQYYSLAEDDLYVLSDNPELAEIGELIVSSMEKQWEHTSLLVFQHCMVD